MKFDKRNSAILPKILKQIIIVALVTSVSAAIVVVIGFISSSQLVTSTAVMAQINSAAPGKTVNNIQVASNESRISNAVTAAITTAVLQH